MHGNRTLGLVGVCQCLAEHRTSNNLYFFIALMNTDLRLEQYGAPPMLACCLWTTTAACVKMFALLHSRRSTKSVIKHMNRYMKLRPLTELHVVAGES